MAKRKKTQKAARSATGKWRWLRKLLLWGSVAFLAFVVVLDIRVITQFEGRKWALPAHVYARSLEIYRDMQLTADELQWELKSLGYQAVERASAPGYFSRNGNTIDLYARQFKFWDGEEPARAVRIRFSGGAVAGIARLDDGARINLLRLEPLRIGGIYPGHWEDREVVKLSEIPHYLPDALVAVEDRHFYKHQGVSPRAIARAVKANLQNQGVVEGGSTITQQLVKNFYLNAERSLQRKVMEAVMALLLDLHYSKREILETYINEIYLGQAGKRGIHGYGLASRHYFSKPVGELQLHQVALLVAIGKGASYYNPWKYPQRARERRDLVLDVMTREGVITDAQAAAAKKRPLGVPAQPSSSYNDYPGYLELVKRQLKEDYRESDLSSEGLRVFTNLDPLAQSRLERTIDERLKRIEGDYRLKDNSLQSAAVVVQVGTGEVIALAGDRKARFNGFNRALDARRQVGSTIKPAIYLTALQQPGRYTLSTLIPDKPVSVPDKDGKIWTPRNFENQSHGDVPLYQALGQSYNQASVALGMELGVGNVIRTLRKLGYEGEIAELPSTLLGSVAMTPMEVATVYHTLAADGFYTPLRAIREVYTADNQPLKRYPYQAEQRFSAADMHLIQYAMQVVMREGTGKSAYKWLPEKISLAGKTGTTNDQRDSWFSGFSGNYLAVSWIGRDDNGRMPITGGTGALQIWSQFMSRMDPQPLLFHKPDNVSYEWVETATNLRSAERCEGARYLPFVEGSEPHRRAGCARRRSALGDWIRDALDWIRQ